MFFPAFFTILALSTVPVYFSADDTGARRDNDGAVYVRWGRTECSAGADLVYSGFVGGSHYTTTGGGSNYICLPNQPVFNYFNSDEKPSKIYGAEFEGPSPGFSLANAEADHLQDQNVPCAVCQSKRYSQLMIPARNVCYPGWTPEYSGYLMSGHPVHAGRYEFVCMDEKPETEEGGFPDENGALFYNVEGVCGSLPCPPYISRREITCVVCSK